MVYRLIDGLHISGGQPRPLEYPDLFWPTTGEAQGRPAPSGDPPLRPVIGGSWMSRSSVSNGFPGGTKPRCSAASASVSALHDPAERCIYAPSDKLRPKQVSVADGSFSRTALAAATLVVRHAARLAMPFEANLLVVLWPSLRLRTLCVVMSGFVVAYNGKQGSPREGPLLCLDTKKGHRMVFGKDFARTTRGRAMGGWG